ncbi:hypothetical protein ACHQM5_000974 [Ranunculus cassubicifolius]
MEEEKDCVLIDGLETLDLNPEDYAGLYNEDFQRTFGDFSDAINVSPICYERPTKQLKGATTDTWNSCSTEKSSAPEAASLPNVACLEKRIGSPNSKDDDQNDAPKSGGRNKKTVNTTARSPGTVEHMIAERKRRGKLTQQFIELTALVPGVTKVDKVSVLVASTKYIKHLKTRVKELEEQTSKKTMESAVFVKKSQVSSHDTNTYLTEKSSSDFQIEQLPKIEAIISDGNVLIRIQCEKHRGAMAQLLLEIEKLKLNVVSSILMPFGNSFAITVMSQMNAECNMTVKDLVKKLGASIV